MTQEIEKNENDPNTPNIGALFKRYADEKNNEATHNESVEKKEVKKVKKDPVPIETKEVAKEAPIKPEVIEKSSEPAIDWKSEVEKLQKNLKETRKWGDETKRQLSSYKKAIEKFKEDGNLTEEEASELLNHTKYQELENKSKSFVERAAEVWDREIENIRRYSDYPDLDKHLHAFQHFIHNGSQDEVNEAYEDIKDLIDSNPIMFTKKMLQIGQRYHDEIFGELMDAGNIKNLKSRYEEKLESSQKKIEKLEKELTKLKDKYEGYDENPNYRMPQGGDSNDGNLAPSSLKRPGQLIEKFNQGRHALT